jgi:hypothetical protein
VELSTIRWFTCPKEFMKMESSETKKEVGLTPQSFYWREPNSKNGMTPTFLPYLRF